MKKIIITLLLFLLALAGCQPTDRKEEEIDLVAEETFDAQVEPLITSKQSFHFIVDWLSEEEIVYVELKDELYHIVAYNIHTREFHTLYKESSIVANVLIHPTKEYILLHTSEDDSSATVKMVDLEGHQVYELNIESNELDIQWNDLDPRYLMLTAFHEDWTYDHYFYNAYENDLSLMTLSYPFAKWLGEEEVVMFSNDAPESLEGKRMEVLNVITKDVHMQKNHILYYDTYQDALLTMEKKNDTTALFKVMNDSLQTVIEWEAPLVSNYSEWVIPEVSWLSGRELITYIPHEGGLLDDLPNGFMLMKIGEHKEHIIDHQMNEALRCSPSKTMCLTGSSFTNIISIDTGQSFQWVLFEEE